MDTTKLIYAALEENSNKFWTATWDGGTVTFTWGRVGESGQTTVKSFPDEYKAEKAYRKKVSEKLAKGYTPQYSADAQAAPVGNLREIARKQIEHSSDPDTSKRRRSDP
jgi:predicted DNA-binding WGR domain protein